MGRTGKISLLILSVILLVSPVIAGELSLKATVDKMTVALDETVNYTLTVSGGGQNLPLPAPPQFVNLTAVSRFQTSNVSIMNGQASVSSSMTYILRPDKVGSASIGTAVLDYNGQSYRSDPIALKVTAATGTGKAAPTRQAAPVDPWDKMIDEIFNRPLIPRPVAIKDPIKVKMSVSRANPYVNQLVVLTFTFYRRVNLLEQPIYMPPSTTGFWSVSLPNANNQRQEVIDGINYLAQDYRMALFPISAGPHLIKEASLRARVYQGAPTLLKTDLISINVRPLPEAGKPADFGGSVGRYQLSVAPSVREVERGKPFTVIAKVFGEGNIQSVSEPVLAESEAFKRLSSTSKEKVTAGAASVAGSKTFELAILPLKEGKLTIPALTFSYFEPESGAYRQIKSQPIAIKVLPSNLPLPKGLDAASRSLPDGSVKISFDWRSPLRWFYGVIISPVFLVSFGLIVLLVVLYFAWRRWRDNLSVNHFRVARDRLKRARELLQGSKLKEYVGELFEAVFHYLGDKYTFPITGATTDEIKELLAGKGIAAAEQKEIEKFFNECDLIRFTPSSLDRAAADKLLQKAESLIVLLESNSYSHPG
ncbi:MAG: BatD family protein [Candidatus Margulisiibacteriota bacterium]|jgi:hypothetical protein